MCFETDKYMKTDSYLIIKLIDMKDSIQMDEPCDPCKLTPMAFFRIFEDRSVLTKEAELFDSIASHISSTLLMLGDSIIDSASDKLEEVLQNIRKKDSVTR